MISLWQLGAGLTALSTVVWWLLDRRIAAWLSDNDDLTAEIAEISKPELEHQTYGIQHQKQEGQVLLAAVRAASMRMQRYQILNDPDRFLPDLLVARFSVLGIVAGAVLMAFSIFAG